MAKNRIFNPQFVTDAPPETVEEKDLGRMWVDIESKKMKIALPGSDGYELRNFLDTDDRLEMDDTYHKEIKTKILEIIPQQEGDKHFDNGYDFFSDEVFLANADNETQEYYSYYYKEVPDTSSDGYVRSISTIDGVKHIRTANGKDTYELNGVVTQLVKYSKIDLGSEIKGVFDISFVDTKDVLEAGFELSDDKKSVLIFADPDGFFIGKKVKIRYFE